MKKLRQEVREFGGRLVKPRNPIVISNPTTGAVYTYPFVIRAPTGAINCRSLDDVADRVEEARQRRASREARRKA